MASDMRLNDKPIAKDGAYIYAEAADGSQVKISKADLASVVAELAPIRTTIYNQDISSGSSLDVSSKFFNVGFFICDFANSYYCIGLVLNNNNIFYLTPEAQIPTGVTISRNGNTGVFSIINNSGKDLRGIKLRLFSNNRD